MGLDFSKMSSTTIFSIALLAALVILLIVLIIVTVKVLSKGKKDDEEEYTERRYTTRKGGEEEAEDSGSKKSPKPAKASKPKKVEEDDEDDDEDDEDDEDEKASDEDAEEKPEVKDEVAAVVEAALQAKAKAAELEARVAKEKAEKAAAEAEQAAKKASEAEAEVAQAASRKKKAAEPVVKAPVAEAPEEEEPDEKDEDEFGQTDEIPVARINRELEKQKVKEADVLKATTRIADADQIIEAVKEAKGKKSKADEETLLAEEAAEVVEAVAAAEAAAGEAEESTPAGEDSAFGKSAPPLKEEETKKTLETTFDSAFTDTQLHQEIEGRKDELTDSAFGTETPVAEEEIKPLQVSGETITVNPVNAVNITTVNAVEPVATTNPEAGIHDAAEMSAFLQDNPVPKKKKKKMKKKDQAFADKFDHDGPEIKGAQYLWYNNQDIEALTKKEDMYYYCHYFNDPAKAVLPLIIEMYDCAFVRTEELQKIAYGIQYKSMGLREILTSKDNVSFDRSKIAKDPSEQDLLQIRAKWCDYVDNFLQIIVLQAPDQVQEYIRNQLYAYGENDVDTLLFCPEPEDEEE